VEAPGTGPQPAAGLLRPALELAWTVARMGEEATPPVVAPGPVRKLLRFSRLPDRALATLRRAVEDDFEFRARVAEVATEEMVGRASWLWLARPDGWEDDLSRLDDEAARSATSAKEQQDERSARRRLEAAEEARRKAETAVAAATAANARTGEELSIERQARRAAEARAESLAGRAAQLETRAEAAERAGGRLREEAGALTAERDRLRARVEALEEELAAARLRPEEPSRAVAAEAMAEVAARIADAAAAASALGIALAGASAGLGGGPRPEAGQDGAPGPAGPVGTTTTTPGAASRGRAPAGSARGDRGRGGPRRRPTPLPPAVFEDSAEAAVYLLRIPAMVLLVDGYNVSLDAWPDLPIPEQRRRLVDALAGLAARTGVEAQIVFDGAEQAEPRAGGPPPRSPVRVRFSPPEVDADDVLIELIDDLPPGRPVTVASSDRRVQDEVRRRGASVISSAQLLGAIAGR
jgi:predicted RNA-binding protein with PIN domain